MLRRRAASWQSRDATTRLAREPGATGIAFPFISVHLAVTGGAAGVHHHRALALIEKFVRSIHQTGSETAIVAGHYNYPYARSPLAAQPLRELVHEAEGTGQSAARRERKRRNGYAFRRQRS